ncbi:hypothetical protein ALC62_11064 [Cyphomyrmex costatus]|uniref:Uncharacterized protein n=1 Tax=Cyphomyrmex costatus TaxID=456900 RepID=A0A151ICS6_9HYME|nr:hypothetical protein ALC62_11064 [Cyphomyrmex costatus]
MQVVADRGREGVAVGGNGGEDEASRGVEGVDGERERERERGGGGGIHTAVGRSARKGRDEAGTSGAKREAPDKLERKEELKDETGRKMAVDFEIGTVARKHLCGIEIRNWFKVDFFPPTPLYRRYQRSDDNSGDPDPAGRGAAAILFNEDFPTKGNEECNVRR